jgi:hypothetical protein
MAVSQREMRRRERYRRQFTSRILWGALAALVLAGLGYLGWQALKPRPGVSVSIMSATRHIEIGEQHETYNSDPPTSGTHYVQPAQAGFYDQALPDEQLVHNLEHGYVIFWYNCAKLDEAACNDLKANIKSVIRDVNNIKIIASPRDSIDVPVMITSWGRLQRMETFDVAQALAFYKTNLNRSPEPSAP